MEIITFAKNKMSGMELDLAYLCKEVREIARTSAIFLKEERRKFDRNLVEEKVLITMYLMWIKNRNDRS